MSLPHWLRSPGQKPRNLVGWGNHPARRGRPVRPPELEVLEDRTVLSVSVFRSADVPKAITDNSTAVSSTLNVAPSILAGDINVTVNINHARAQDLRLTLVDPDGDRVELVSNVNFPGSGNDRPFKAITLNDQAGTSISTAATLFAGEFRPQNALSAFNDEDAQGTWTLEVQDTASGVAGTLIDWSLTITNRVTDTEPNNTLAQAQVIDASQVVVGGINPNGDSDLFRFNLTQRTRFTAHVDGTGGTLDPRLVLTNLAGQEIVRSDDVSAANSSAYLEQILEAGDYVVSVSAQVPLAPGADQPYRLLTTTGKADSTITGEAVGDHQSALTTADLNGDGFLDIATSTGSTKVVAIFLGDASGTFRKAANVAIGTIPVRLLVVDVNQDSRLDLISLNQLDNDVSVALGNGDGTFQAQQRFGVGTAPSDIQAADIDGVNGLDLITANTDSDNVSVLLNNGNGTFQAHKTVAVGDAPVLLRVGLINNDQLLDVVVANNTSANVSVLLGTGNAATPLGAATNFAAGTVHTGLELLDVNNDTKQDVLAFSGTANEVSVLLGNGDGTLQNRTQFALGSSPGSPLLIDVNNDTVRDIVTINFSSNDVSVLLGNANGTFQAQQRFAVGTNPTEGAAADLNRDGFLDLMTVNKSSDDVSVLLGNGNGTFRPQVRYAAGARPEFITVGDVDHNGFIDVIAGNETSRDLTILLGNGNGTLQAVERSGLGSDPASPLLVDLNTDGRPDLISVNTTSNEVSVLLGNGDGSFQARQSFATGNRPALVRAVDVNRDGRLDLIVGNVNSSNVSVLLGNGDGTFRGQELLALGDSTISLLVADLNADGFLDLLAGRQSGGVGVFLGNGDGTFQARLDFATGLAPNTLEVIDINNDLRPDLITSNQNSANVSVRLGTQVGILGAEQQFAMGTAPRLLPLRDIDSDNDLDLVTINADTDNLSVRLGNGMGGFGAEQQFAVGAIRLESQVRFAHLNQDAFLDVVVAVTNADKVAVLLGSANGTFGAPTLLTTGGVPIALDVDDVNGDGFQDLAVGAGNRTISVILGNGDGTFQPRNIVTLDLDPQLSVDLIDLNADGRLDLVGTSDNSRRAAVLFGAGDGTFSSVIGQAVDLRHTPFRGDLDGDGTQDIVVLNDRGQILFRRGLPGTNNQFAPPVVVNPNRPAREIALFNVNRQGGLPVQIAAADRAGNNVVLHRFQAGAFVQGNPIATGALPQRLGVADLDGDNRDDLVIGNSQGQSLTVALSNGAAGLNLFRQIAVGVGPSDITFADLDGQNGLDILVSNQSSGDVVIVYNDGAAFLAPRRSRFRADDLSVPFFQQLGGLPHPQMLAQPVALVAGQFTGDTKTDVVVINRGTHRLNTLLGTPGGGLSNVASNLSFLSSNGLELNFRPDQTVTADFDRDNDLDLAVLMKDQGEVWIYQGDGTGSFTLGPIISVGNAPSGLALAQLNDDNNNNQVNGSDFVDLMVGNGFGDVLFILGNGNGTFRPFVRADRQVPFVATDLDNNGTIDVILADEARDAARSLTRDQQASTFTPGAFQRDGTNGLIGPGDVALADVDRANGADLIFANTGSNNVLVYLRQANGSFASDPMSFFVGTNPTGLHVGQLNDDNNDGQINNLDFVDVAVANQGSNDVSLLRGTGGADLFRLGPRLSTGTAGPAFVRSEMITGDAIPDIVSYSTLGGTGQMIPGVGGGFFNDTGATSVNLGGQPVDTDGDFVLIGNGNIVQVDFNTATATTVFTATGRQGVAIDAVTVPGFDFPVFFLANSDSTVSALISFDGASYLEAIARPGDGLDSPSALAVLESNGGFEVYVSDAQDSSLVVLRFGIDDLTVGLAPVGGSASLALVATLSNNSLLVDTRLQLAELGITPESVFGLEEVATETAFENGVVVGLGEQLLSGLDDGSTLVSADNETSEEGEPQGLQQFLSGLDEAMRQLGWKRGRENRPDNPPLDFLLELARWQQRGQEVIDLLLSLYRVLDGAQGNPPATPVQPGVQGGPATAPPLPEPEQADSETRLEGVILVDDDGEPVLEAAPGEAGRAGLSPLLTSAVFASSLLYSAAGVGRWTRKVPPVRTAPLPHPRGRRLPRR